MYYKKYGELPKIDHDGDLKALAGLQHAHEPTTSSSNKTLTTTPTDDVTLKLEPSSSTSGGGGAGTRCETATSMTSTKLNQSMTTSTDVGDNNSSTSPVGAGDDDYQDYDENDDNKQQSMNESSSAECGSSIKKPEAKMLKLSNSPNTTLTDVHMSGDDNKANMFRPIRTPLGGTGGGAIPPTTNSGLYSINSFIGSDAATTTAAAGLVSPSSQKRNQSNNPSTSPSPGGAFSSLLFNNTNNSFSPKASLFRPVPNKANHLPGKHFENDFRGLNKFNNQKVENSRKPCPNFEYGLYKVVT